VKTHKLLLGLMGLSLAAMNVAQVQPRTRLKKAPATYVLAGKGTVTLEEALPVVCQVVQLTPEGQAYARSHGGSASTKGFEAQCAELEALKIMPGSWRGHRTGFLTRGKVAYMACSILKVKPGLVTGLFGMSERYAHREMAHRELMAGGAVTTYVTGTELVSVLSRVSMRLTAEPGPTIEEGEYH